MKVIRPNCRAHFTPADFAFISANLPQGRGLPPSGDKPVADGRWIFRLMGDSGSLDIMLDNPSLFRSLLELKGCLPVSLHFYFYVLVRHVLLKEDIRDKEVADYVAEVLAEFASHQRWRRPESEESQPMDYFHELLAAAEQADEQKRFGMLAHIGNYALFLAGLFPHHLMHRAERRAAPNFNFYEEMGASHFRLAGGHYLARKFDLAPVLLTLGKAFRLTRVALNHLSEKLVFLETHSAVQDLLREIDSPDGPASRSRPPGRK